jgi:four helix bundle protein
MGKGFEDLEVPKEAAKISDEIRGLTGRWDSRAREVVGLQLARAADSVGANIAEAYGRFLYLAKIRFLHYARGSLFETRFWLNRAESRRLTTRLVAQDLQGRLVRLARRLNSFIRNLRDQSHRGPRDTASLRESAAVAFSIEPGVRGQTPSAGETHHDRSLRFPSRRSLQSPITFPLPEDP